MRMIRLVAAAFLLASPVLAQTSSQTTTDPFPDPIPTKEGAIAVNFTEFASLPDINGQPARMMILVDEPGTKRLFVNDMRGPLYTVSYDGKTVTKYLDINDAKWGHPVQSNGTERGFQSFAIHPDFARRGAPGFGKVYTLIDTSNTQPAPDFKPGGGTRSHDSVLLEWTARNPAAETFDGEAPRELFRAEQPFANHNGGQLGFNPLARQGQPDYGLLYVGFADGGSGGDPFKMAQNLGSLFGKLLRIDPLGSNSANKKYGIPADNPFAKDNADNTLGEIYAYGLRNPQRFSWDPRNGNLFLADIGQNTVEEIDLVTKGANLGWNDWEGSFGFVNRVGVGLTNQRGDAKVTYPIVEYGQPDPLFQSNSAVTMGYVYRQTTIKQLTNLLLFGDNPSGEIFYVNADKLPSGGQAPIRRILFNDNGTQKNLLDLVKAKAAALGKPAPTRADLRFGQGPNGQIFILNKRDGVIRLLVPTR